MTLPPKVNEFWQRLFQPIDNASLVFFRIAFGVIMLVSAFRYFHHGWIEEYYVYPSYFFSYFGFDWVKPWPGNGMYWHFGYMGVLAVFIGFGFLYRISAVLNFLAFTYVFLLDQTRYLNHYYLVSIISFIIIFLPLHRSYSLDAKIWPKLKNTFAPQWTLWLLQFQIGVPYFFGGIAKLNGDWLRGEPMRMWLSERTDFAIIGPLFEKEWVVYFFTYGGLLLDLLVVPFLLIRKTRMYAFIFSLLFHLMNVHLFSIGIFPWFMIAATLLFFDPDWPRKIIRKFKSIEIPKGPGKFLPSSFKPIHGFLVSFWGIFILFQVFFPLRHYLYPGDVNWTEEGHKFSWHMKLRDKDADVQIYVTGPVSKVEWEIGLTDYLTYRQIRKMSKHPEMIQSFCHFIRDVMKEKGLGEVEVRAWAMTSLNGREPQMMIDPTTNLAAIPRSILPQDWVMPLVLPLKSNKS